ncbi:unnamed protein product, partial [Durusdinium trenchii]
MTPDVLLNITWQFKYKPGVPLAVQQWDLATEWASGYKGHSALYVTDHRAPVNPVEDRPAMLMKSFGSLNETKNAELVYGYPLGKHQFDGQLAYHQPPDPDANLSGMSKHKRKANCLMPDALDLEKGEIGDEAEKFQKI